MVSDYSYSRRRFLISLGALAVGVVVLTTSSCSLFESCAGNGEAGMHPYYRKKKDEITSEFDGLLELIDPLLRQHVDATTAQDVLDAARARFSSSLEELPYIGGDDNWLTGNLVHASMAAALYIPLKERGRSVDEAGRMFYEAVEQAMSEQIANPPVPAHDAEAIRQAREKERNFDAWTLKRDYPYNWVGEYVDGEGKPFDYGRDWIECGNVKLYKHYGVEELTPYMCLMDCIFFRATGMGLHRTKTLAQGDDRCDFRTSLSDREISLEHLSAKTLRQWGKCDSGCCVG